MSGIEIKNLSVYGESGEVLKKIALCVESGKAFALTGKSDKAKRLLLRLMQKYNDETAAFVESERIFGEPNKQAKPFLKRVVFGCLTVVEYMDYVFGAKSGSRAQKRTQFLDALKTAGIARLANTKIKRLSAPNRRLANLAIALVRCPQAVILEVDDLSSCRKTRAALNIVLSNLKRKGICVVLSCDAKMIGTEIDCAGNLQDGELKMLEILPKNKARFCFKLDRKKGKKSLSIFQSRNSTEKGKAHSTH